MWEDFSVAVERGISQMFCFPSYSWLLWMFINLNRKNEKKPNKPIQLPCSLLSYSHFWKKSWFYGGSVKHKTQPFLNSELSLRKCTRVWNIVCYFCCGRHLCTAPPTIFKITVPNHYRGIWENIYFFIWKHNVLKEAACTCSCSLTAYVEAVLLHKTALCLVLFS